MKRFLIFNFLISAQPMEYKSFIILTIESSKHNTHAHLLMIRYNLISPSRFILMSLCVYAHCVLGPKEAEEDIAHSGAGVRDR